MKQKKNLYVSYLGYGLEQELVETCCCHQYSKDGKNTISSSYQKSIKRSTKKQLQRYLRYLVSSGIIQKFSLPKPDADILAIPRDFDEYTNVISYKLAQNVECRDFHHSDDDEDDILYVG